MSALDQTIPKFYCDGKEVKYYLEDLGIDDLDINNLAEKSINGSLSAKEIMIISECFEESMACGALCKYLFLKNKPNIEMLSKDNIIEIVPGVYNAMSIEKEEEFEIDWRYTKENMQISVITWGSYYIVEVYFSH